MRRIVASIWNERTTIKYKVDGVDEFKFTKINSRGENNLFKTIEEADKYCVEVNTKQTRPEF